MPRIRVLPYKQGSKSAKALAEALGGKVIRLTGSTFVPRQGDFVINWGNTMPQFAHVYPATFIQLPNTVRNVSNKLNFFNLMKEKQLGELIPKFWIDPNEIPDEEFPVVCRTVLAGHSGDGIHLAASRDDLVAAPLYTKYVKKKDEYRVHIGRSGEWEVQDVLAVQRKAKRSGVEDVNWQVRNHANGFVYVREHVCPPEAVLHAACKTFAATGLDFGAVDVIWNEHQQRAYVLEVNTAPGLEGQTVTDYANYFKSAYHD